MNTEQLLRERAESILKEHTALYMTSPEKAVFVNAMLDFVKQELSRLGEIYVVCNKNEAEYYLDKEGDLLPVKKLSLEEKIEEK